MYDFIGRMKKTIERFFCKHEWKRIVRFDTGSSFEVCEKCGKIESYRFRELLGYEIVAIIFGAAVSIALFVVGVIIIIGE